MNLRAKISFLVSAVLLTALTFVGLLRASAAGSTRTYTVVIEAMKFAPDIVRIKPEDRVRFENRGILPHTATAKGPKAFDSGLIKPGESWTSQPVGNAATIQYVCLYHPTMEGRIVVERP